MASTPDGGPAGEPPEGTVRIHYLRPPDRLDIFTQRLIHQGDDAIVTLLERTPMPRAMTVHGRTVLEDGSPVVWFTFPGAWHDVGRFHTAAGEPTGFYANVLEPVRLVSPREWHATDLFLDVWLGVDGHAAILDEDELDAAVAAGWLEPATAAAARAEADRLLAAARAGAWPPPVVRAWTLERARAVAGRATPPRRSNG